MIETLITWVAARPIADLPALLNGILLLIAFAIPVTWLIMSGSVRVYGDRSFMAPFDFGSDTPPSDAIKLLVPLAPKSATNSLTELDQAKRLADRLRLPGFVHRRVERIAFSGYRRVRRHVSVDVEIDDGSTLLPVYISHKDPTDNYQVGLRAFSVRAEPWGSLPLLGRYENSVAIYRALSYWCETRMPEAMAAVGEARGSAGLTSAERAWLWSIVSGSEFQASGDLERIEQAVGAARRLIKATSSEEGGNSDDLSTWSAVGKLRRLAAAAGFDAWLWVQMRRLASNWVLIVQVPEGDRRSRVVVKLEFDDYLKLSGSFGLSLWDNVKRAISRVRSPSKMRASAIQGVRRFLRSLGWLPSVLEVPTLTSLPSRSLHVEFEAPFGLEIDSLLLTTYPAITDDYRNGLEITIERSRNLQSVDVLGRYRSRGHRIRVASDAEAPRHTNLGHAYLPRIEADLVAQAFVGVRLERTSHMLGSAVGMVLLAALVWLGSIHPPSALGGPEALVFGIPGALTGLLLLRQHDLVSGLSSVLRVALMLATALALVAILIITLANTRLGSCAHSEACVEAILFVKHGFQYLRWPATILCLLILPAVGPPLRPKRTRSSILPR
jgi:hypothetical protein